MDMHPQTVSVLFLLLFCLALQKTYAISGKNDVGRTMSALDHGLCHSAMAWFDTATQESHRHKKKEHLNMHEHLLMLCLVYVIKS
jgi:hypothetical protein